MSNPKFFRFRSRIKSFGFALQGIATFFKTQTNAWIHLLSAFFACVAGCVLNLNPMEWCVIAVSISLVFIAEMLNTAIEFLT
ncbi:MAG TPA: diacylglycerol kinase family protein, partial [Chitinophagales bacterium]|nr:diacylglycerol kinase family protein [Chitinophagales bacterium]